MLRVLENKMFRNRAKKVGVRESYRKKYVTKQKILMQTY